MLKSKALKGFEEDPPINKLQELWYKFYLSNFYSIITKPYTEIRRCISRLKKNYLFWKNVLRYDWDFDFHGHFRMLHYKLKTVHDCIIDDYAIQEEKDMHALRLCIKLAKKLDDDEYDERTWRKIEAQFGKMGSRFENTVGESGYSRMITNYGGNESEEYIAKVWEVKKAMYEVSEKCMHRDERNLYAIMLKYRKAWWS